MPSCTIESTHTAPVNWQHKSHCVFIGRPSKWGNPYDVHTYGRAGCVTRYYTWVSERIMLGELDLDELNGKVLVCFCVPKLCHGHILKAMLEENEHIKLRKEGTTNARENEREYSRYHRVGRSADPDQEADQGIERAVLDDPAEVEGETG